jgi:hypothetical protein
MSVAHAKELTCDLQATGDRNRAMRGRSEEGNRVAALQGKR